MITKFCYRNDDTFAEITIEDGEAVIVRHEYMTNDGKQERSYRRGEKEFERELKAAISGIHAHNHSDFKAMCMDLNPDGETYKFTIGLKVDEKTIPTQGHQISLV